MTMLILKLIRLPFFLMVALVASVCTTAWGSDQNERIEEKLAALEQQNALLMQLVESQQSAIDDLRTRLDDVTTTTARQTEVIEELQESSFDSPAPPARTSLSSSIHISGEAGIAFHAGEANTNFPNEEFRVDEARIFIDAQVAQGVYLFSELELFTSEANTTGLQVGELYIEFEELLAIGDWERALNFRAGRLNIPFGEEYQSRDVMGNPLISHSIADPWGIDEGLEAFGELGQVSYIVAVQNGSHDLLRDYTSGKSITARVGFDPASNFHLSGSVMRTGDIDTKKETFTEIWFGSAFFRSIGSPDTTRFDVELAQLDATFSWQDGHLRMAYGKAWYDDNDPARNNQRDLKFWHVQAQQGLSDKLFAAVRYSGMDAKNGYPVAGMGSRGKYFFNPYAPLATELRRLSMGITYWPYPDLVLKLDYTLEDGEHGNGSKRTDTNKFTAEAGVRF